MPGPPAVKVRIEQDPDGRYVARRRSDGSVLLKSECVTPVIIAAEKAGYLITSILGVKYRCDLMAYEQN